MAAITDVTLTAGVPTAGTGTVTTLDKFDSAAGVSASRALTVQGIASGTAMPVSMATVPSHAVTNAGTFVTQENGAGLTALQLIDDNMVAPGTAIGSTKNAMVGGSVTTAAPTYTTGQVSPLSLDTAGALRVTGAGGGTQYTEDVAAATDPIGNMLIAVRKDTLSTSEVSADGDNIALKASSKGKLHVAAEMRLGDTVADTGSGTGGTATQRMIIDSSQLDPTVAHDAVDSGTPYKQGGRAVAGMSGITLVAAADRTDSLHGLDGAQYVRPHCGLEDIVSGRATDTAGTSTSCIASSGAGVKTYLTSVALCNSSATPVTVNLLDGASVKYTLSVPAGSGNNKEFTVPLPGTAATAWNFQSSAAATTITCSMIGFKSKV